MFGKASILLVLGFSLIFLVAQNNSHSISTRSVDNVREYFLETEAHNLAISGANLAANEMFENAAWSEGFENVNVDGKTLNVDVQTLDEEKSIKKITATGTIEGISKTVEVTLQPSKFSKFAYLSISDPTNLYWTHSDTIWGPFHQQNNIKASGHPVFMGKVTTNGIVEYQTSKAADEPEFNGGFQDNVSLNFPSGQITNLESKAVYGGKLFNNTVSDTIYLTFAGENIKWKKGYNLPEIIEEGSSLAPNGVIFAKNVIFKIKGVVTGQYTVASNKDIYLEDDIVYSNDPRIDPNSTDLLGIASLTNVKISNNPPNQHDINIQASIYCEQGGFGAGWSSFPINNGKINLLGGIQNFKRVQIGVIGGYGFSRNYRYDERFRILFPPFYPGTEKFEIISWYE